MTRVARRAAHGARLTILAAVVATAAGCASARPERQLEATTESGRLVPLDSVTISYTVGGLRIIQRPNYANDVVAVHLYLLGGRRQLTPSTQGIESLLLRVSKYGTAKYPGDSTRRAWARTGSDVTIDAADDWTLFGFRAVTQEFDSSWSVFAERLMHPTLSARSVALVRDQMIERVRQRHTSPDGYLGLLSDSVAFYGQPYSLEAEGTEATLPTLDSAALAAYERTQMVTSRMLLVVVGNVSREAVERSVTATVAKLPAGQYVWALPAPASRVVVPAVLRERRIPTNYVLGVFEGPPASSPDYPAFRVATALLSSRILNKVRTEGGLSYSAGAPFTDRAIATGGIYFTTGLPARVLPIIKEQLDYVRHLPPALIDMQYFTDSFIFEYLAENSTDNAQADFLARAQLYRGDYHAASDAMEELRRVTTGRVRSVAQRYFTHIQFVYVGDTSRVTQSAFLNF